MRLERCTDSGGAPKTYATRGDVARVELRLA